jgi:hypothetical protein
MAIMALRPVPYQCIWCLKDPTSATFSSESHVLPKCIGNIAEQVLPKGVVCDECNKYFGRGKGLEARLIEEPILSTLVAILGLRDIGSQFTYEHSPSGVHRTAHIAAKVFANRITLTTQYEIEGQPNKPSEVRTIMKSKDYAQRDWAFLSRAVHKIAFEAVAHNLFVGTGLKYQSKEIGDMDIFDPSFNVIRDWVREGKPQHSVRPALRIQKFDEVERQEQLWEWKGKIGRIREWTYYELDLFHDWYIMSLTSPANKVKGDLVNWVEKRKPNHPVWMVGDELQLMK